MDHKESELNMAKYYWLKLDKDFFKKYDIKIMRSQTNGEKLVLFYLELMCEATSHGGKLRYSANISYNNDMLGKIFNYETPFVDYAMETLKNLELVEILEDGTILLPKVEEAIGCETDGAKKMRKYRENKLQCNNNVITMLSQRPTESEIRVREQSKNIDKIDKIDKSTLLDASAPFIQKLLSFNFLSHEDYESITGISSWIIHNLGNYEYSQFKIAFAYFLNQIPKLKNIEKPDAYFIQTMKNNLTKDYSKVSAKNEENITTEELNALLEGL